jgi:hypothetical protein
MFAALITFSHLGISALIWAANSSVFATTSKPSVANRSFTSGLATAFDDLAMEQRDDLLRRSRRPQHGLEGVGLLVRPMSAYPQERRHSGHGERPELRQIRTCIIVSARSCVHGNRQCDLPTVFPKVISGLRRPIAIQAAISLNMNLPE